MWQFSKIISFKAIDIVLDLINFEKWLEFNKFGILFMNT